jgi:hypothetical protein
MHQRRGPFLLAIIVIRTRADDWVHSRDTVGQVASEDGAGRSRVRGQAVLSHAPTASRAEGTCARWLAARLLEREEGKGEVLEHVGSKSRVD